MSDSTVPDIFAELLHETWHATENGTPAEPGPLHDLDAQELGDALAVLTDAMWELKERTAQVQSVADQIIDRPIVTYNGKIVAPDRTVSRTGWDKKLIRRLVVEQRSRLLIDPVDGEQVRAFPERELGDLLEVKTGVAVARALGQETGDLCAETWASKAKIQ